MSSVFYTVYPLEILFDDDDSPEQPFVRATVSGVPVLVARSGDGHGIIERVLSTDPQHFLDPTIRPGVTVSLV